MTHKIPFSSGCCVGVPQNSVGVIEQFGRFDRMVTSGFNCLNPCCGESAAGYVSLRVQQLAVSCETKTHDNVFVEIVVSVQFRAIAAAAYDAFYKLTNPREQIRAYVYDGISCIFVSYTFNHLLQSFVLESQRLH